MSTSGKGGGWRFRGVGAAVVLASAGVGCSHHEVPPQQVQKMTEYRLYREDVIEVSVWKSPELSRTLPVRPDGKITLPLVGEVAAEGMTTRELEKSLEAKLGTYVRDPHVSVIVHDVNGARVFVTGMVGHPGAFPLRGEINVLQALALAGGLAEFADRGEIAVVTASGERRTFDYDDLINGRARYTLSAGDTVVVP